MGDALRLTGLEVENILRLRAVTLTLGDDGSLIIGGGNEQGKTSVLKALEIALAGGSATPEEPIHGDAKKGRVLVRFDDGLTVEKVFTRGKSPRLVVKNAKGATQKSPQGLLDSLLKRVALDPLIPLRQDSKTQARIISTLMGVDLAPFQRRREYAYEARRDANREVKRLEGALASTPRDPSLPDAEVSVSELAEELGRRRKHNALGGEIETELNESRRGTRDFIERLASQEAEIERLKAALNLAMSNREALQELIAASNTRTEELTTKIARFEPAEEQAILTQMSTAEATNHAVRANARHVELAKEFEAAIALAETCQTSLTQIDTEEAAARASAEERLPVSGLSIDESGVLYNGKPLSQAGTSANIRVWVAVAIALNRKSRVRLLLIDDGESLDADNRRLVLELAREAGFQVIMTLVGKGEAQVVIEDGVVAKEG